MVTRCSIQTNVFCHGVWHADLRVLSTLKLTIDGRAPEHIGTLPAPAWSAAAAVAVASVLTRH